MKLLLVLLSTFMLGSPAMAIGVGVGLAGVDETDDRPKLAANLHLIWNENIFTDALYYGWDFGPVSQRNFIVATGTEYKISGSEYFCFRVGLTLIDQQTTLYKDKTSRSLPNPPKPEVESDVSAGVLMGAVLHMFPKGPLIADLTWDAHLYVPGVAAIFLTFGRVEVVSLVVGTRL